ncbi:CKLF-like MARVEL transmembrane domain-containing protein 6 [Tachysurus fulvidraco]|uniref:CKLF-like MARVEL transmembrane domain-containing protein 6 n=1 Tax=Tachysurus fulvidraco TaxID=1234273 RepID=UPI000F501425|nr:CKLF-like MARVEL transmembrane domain-containing protein 6 [Tachysurus fulvidraco]XP_027009863.1 CKLF-like MARVEL transmembrane domain-containing protein 6 [Tachysurus fulvidraco]
MATQEAVYNSTTTAEPERTSCRLFTVPNSNLNFSRFFVKLAEVLLSFVAFILEEVVNSCTSCSALYFFEFVSCTAFLFTLLLLILLSTPLHEKVGISCWPKLDFGYSVLISVFLFIASITFTASNSGSEVEKATVAFGFLAFVAFLTDVILFYKMKGFPFSGASNDPPTHEVEKLNANGAGGANGAN